MDIKMDTSLKETKLNWKFEKISGNFLCCASCLLMMLFPMPLDKKQVLPVFAWCAAMAMH